MMDASTARSRILTCVELLRSFDPSHETVDVHIEVKLGRDWASRPDALFAQQVFYGCVRHEPVLRAFLNAFYHVHAASLNRADFTLYRVLAYLLVFRLDDLGWPAYTAYLDGVDAPTFTRAYTLLSFVCDGESMSTWVKEAWCALLDRAYVEGTLLARCAAHARDAARWMAAHKMAAMGVQEGAAGGGSDGGMKLAALKVPLTQPRAPNITQPKPRRIPIPERIPVGISARPMPDGMDDFNLEDVEDVAARRREAVFAATARKYDAARDSFKFGVMANPDRTARVRDAVEAERAAQLKFDGFRARSPPPFIRTNVREGGVDGDPHAIVRLNAAAVLREDAAARSRVAADAAAVAAYTTHRRDEEAFERWRERALAEDDAAARAEVVARKEAMAAAATRASAAAAAAAKARARSAARLKREGADAVEAAARAAEEHRAALRTRVVDVKHAVATAPVAAVTACIREKAAAATAIQAESAAAEAELRAVRAVEAEERAEVIRRIRALERVPRASIRLHDPTTTFSNMYGNGGGVFLEEMSLVELRERLAAQRAQHEAAIERTHARIVHEKRARAEMLHAKTETIAERRVRAADVNENARATAAAAAAAAEAARQKREADLALQLIERLDEKRGARDAEMARLAEERERVAKQNMFLGAAKSVLEERRLEQLALGSQRRAGDTQSHTLRTRDAASAARERSARIQAAKDAELEAVALVHARARAAEVERATREAKQHALSQLVRKENAFIASTVRADTLRDMRAEAAPAVAQVVEGTRDRARAAWGGEPHVSMHTRTLSARMHRVHGGPDSDAHALRATMAARLASTGAL